MRIVIDLQRKHFRIALQIFLCFAFFFMVVANGGIGYSPEVFGEETLAEILHQFTTYNSNDGFPGWLGTVTRTAISFLLWTGVISSSFYSQGIRLKDHNTEEHIRFSEIVGMMTLLHIVRVSEGGVYGLENEGVSVGEMFYWVPLAVGILILTVRFAARLHNKKTNLRRELNVATPFLIGTAILLLVMCTQLRDLRRIMYHLNFIIGSFGGYTINLYEIIFYPFCSLLCLFPMLKAPGKTKLRKEFEL